MPKSSPKVTTMKLTDLRPAPYNPRSISDEALAGLSVSIDRFSVGAKGYMYKSERRK